MTALTPEPVRYRRDALVLAAVVAAVLIATFAPYVFAGKTLLSSAAEVPSLFPSGARPDTRPARLRTLDPAAPGNGTEPWLAIEHRITVEERRLPFWDPFNGYGQPFDASMQPQPFYPLTAVLALHPSPRAYTWFVLVRLFVAGWFAALFVRLFAGRSAAAAAGVACALTGYYLLYYDMPHLSVDTMFPMLLWATELVVRRPSAARSAALAIAAGLTYLGGMPESALLTLTAAALYGLLRVRGRAEQLRSIAALAGAHLTGLMLGAIAVFPFAEFVRNSFNVHEASKTGGAVAGLAYDTLWRRGLLTELAPLALGYPWNSIITGDAGHSGVRGFVGCAALLLAAVAVGASFARRNPRTPVVIFLLALAAYCVLKRYGHPLVQWTGSVPLFSLIHYPKYVEFLVGDAVGILAGFGVADLRERRLTPIVFLAAFVVTLAALSALYCLTRPDIPPGSSRYDGMVVLALAALLVTAACAYVVVWGEERMRRAAGIAISAVIALEIFCAYSVQQLWAVTPSIGLNPYASAPYIDFLARHVDRTRERVFGISGMLFPNWPGAYGFADPRALNAVYPQDYLPFVNAFVAARAPSSDEQFDRFTGTRPLDLSSPLVRRWMSISSIAWLASPSPISSVEPPPGAFLGALWSQVSPTISSDKLPAVHTASVEIGGVAEDVLFEHPPNQVEFITTIPVKRRLVAADVALDPVTYEHDPICGGPVSFTMTAETDGRVLARATRTIDPKHVAADRRWLPIQLDLSPAATRIVTLRFATAARDACASYALWGEPRFAARGAAAFGGRRLFRLVHHSEGAYVYRILDTAPRLMLYHRARVVPRHENALNVLTDLSFDPKNEAVVESDVRVAPARGPDRAAVISQRSDEVIADVQTSSAALLVQNDTFSSGWNASVDGRPVPLLRTNFLFRGVAVPAGRHTVRIAYHSGAAALGTTLSVIGLLLVCAMFAASRVRALFARRVTVPARANSAQS